MKHSKIIVGILLLMVFFIIPASGYAHDVSGTKKTTAVAGTVKNWKWTIKNHRIGGYASGQNQGNAHPMQIRMQAYRNIGITLSWSTYATIQAGKTGKTAVRLGCKAPWTFGNHPFRAWINPAAALSPWTGYANAVQTNF
ncbi:MAG: hypothetical protein LBJ07_03435 [Actinomycetes bacterium]|jgi:hypothetical protein|nr:hypothetical protein [Actinomycetes bacterium]